MFNFTHCTVHSAFLSDNQLRGEAHIFLLIEGHGPQTGRCVPNDKPGSFGNDTVCEIQSW